VIVFGTDAGAVAEVRVLDSFTLQPLLDLHPFDGFTGGVVVATGDINHDGVKDIVVATATGASHVKVFDGRNGSLLASFLAFPGFTGGVQVAAGDLDGDGFTDVIVAPTTGASHVKVFSGAALTNLAATGSVDAADSRALLRSFIAFPDSKNPSGFSGGVRLAAGDLDGDGLADVVAVAGPGGNGHIKAFSGATNALIASYLAYQGFDGEVNVAVGQVGLAGLPSIITTATDPTLGIHAKVRDGISGAELQSFIVQFSLLPADQILQSANPLRVARPAAVDVNADGQQDLLFITGGFANTQVKILDATTLSVLDQLFAFDPTFTHGGFIAAG
jgi:serralysin